MHEQLSIVDTYSVELESMAGRTTHSLSSFVMTVMH